MLCVIYSALEYLFSYCLQNRDILSYYLAEFIDLGRFSNRSVGYANGLTGTKEIEVTHRALDHSVWPQVYDSSGKPDRFSRDYNMTHHTLHWELCNHLFGNLGVFHCHQLCTDGLSQGGPFNFKKNLLFQNTLLLSCILFCHVLS